MTLLKTLKLYVNFISFAFKIIILRVKLIFGISSKRILELINLYQEAIALEYSLLIKEHPKGGHEVTISGDVPMLTNQQVDQMLKQINKATKEVNITIENGGKL
jgi:hypothetical protein